MFNLYRRLIGATAYLKTLADSAISSRNLLETEGLVQLSTFIAIIADTTRVFE